MLTRQPASGFGRGKPVAITLPLWRQGLAVNAWTEIAGSSMSASPPSVDPGGSNGISSILNAWCGLSIDTRVNRVWSPANGGHDDTHENGVRYLDLMLNAPVWIEVLASNTSGEIVSYRGRYTNGRPASCHSYGCNQFIEARNRAMRFGATAVSTSGFSWPNVEGFDCNTAIGVNGWDAEDTYPPLLATPVKLLPSEDIVAFEGNNSVHRWDQVANTWSVINVGYPPVDPSEAAMAHDSTRDRVFLLRANDIAHTFSPSTGTFTAQTLSGTASTALLAAAKAAGMVYIPSLDAYLVRLGQTGGGAVYVIDASTFAVTLLSTTGGSSVPMTASISGAPENVYTKWLHAPNLGGVVYVPSYSANAWFLRIS